MSDDESVKEQQQRESNDRIFKALRRLRQTGAKYTLPTDGATVRTWGSLCVGYPDDHADARTHCLLKPFMYTKSIHIRKQIEDIFFRHGIMKMEAGGKVIEDVYTIVGGVDSFKKIQLFISDNTLEEYLLLS